MDLANPPRNGLPQAGTLSLVWIRRSGFRDSLSLLGMRWSEKMNCSLVNILQAGFFTSASAAAIITLICSTSISMLYRVMPQEPISRPGSSNGTGLVNSFKLLLGVICCSCLETLTAHRYTPLGTQVRHYHALSSIRMQLISPPCWRRTNLCY